MKDFLKNLQSKKYVGVAEFSAQVAIILEKSNTYQEKGTVTELPDERTIRFYITENLIPPSTEKKGTASVFGYEHLLALLAIKKLQAQNLPIKKIREILVGKTISELEKLLGIDAPKTSAKNEAQQYLETLLYKQGSETNEPQPPLFARASPSNSSDQESNPRTAQSWKRFEIARGLELHIEKKFKVPSDSKERRTLIKVIEEIIQLLSK
jgi:DNA-binding transcriptional MerR regulator